MKTLKAKITCVYIFLVLIIAAVGISSVVNFYRLGRSINGLMVRNYKSISAVRYMNEALEDQNRAIFDYIYTGSQNSIDKYYKSQNEFYKWYSIEANNITEPHEREVVSLVNSYYTKYLSLFPRIKSIKTNKNDVEAYQLYNKDVSAIFQGLKNSLGQITGINETAMFNGKSRVNNSAVQSMYITMILSILAILIGFAVASFLTNKFLKPLYTLKENMKATKEGHMKQEITVLYNDEIGDLTIEFNKMLHRLQIFEKSTKGKLLAEKNRSLAIVKSISDPLIVLDTEFKVILINYACELFFGVDEKDALNKHFLDVIRNSDVFEHIKKAYAAAEEKYTPKIITVSTKEKDFYFDTIVTKVKNEESVISGLVILFQNITKLKKLEKTKTEFVSTISHEFKTPLTSIMMGTSLVKSGGLGEINEKQLEVIRTIEDDTERLAKLVNDIIQLSKIESDKAIFNFRPCSLFGIIENCIKTFAEQVTVKDINLISEVHENLPRIMGDYEKITWVINNLISNAIKYTNAGDSISINASVKQDMMHISVKDTGIGIPDEYKEKIFDKFVKVDSNDYESTGTGLGLAIAQEIVEIHRGSIWCESEIDVGSTFTFTIPLAN